MARYQCRCGEVLSNTSAPNDVELRVFSDKEWDTIIQNDYIEPKSPRYDVWRCSKCERVYVFDPEKGGKLVRVYTIEDEPN